MMKTAKCCVKSVIGVKVINKRFLEFQTKIPRKYKKKKTPAPPRKKILRILEFLSARNSRFYLGILEFPRNLLFQQGFLLSDKLYPRLKALAGFAIKCDEF